MNQEVRLKIYGKAYNLGSDVISLSWKLNELLNNEGETVFYSRLENEQLMKILNEMKIKSEEAFRLYTNY